MVISEIGEPRKQGSRLVGAIDGATVHKYKINNFDTHSCECVHIKYKITKNHAKVCSTRCNTNTGRF